MPPVSLLVVGAGERGTGYAFAALGYHIVLEKPMALDEESCRRVVTAVEKSGVLLAGHVAVLAAERARVNGTVETLQSLY